MLDTNVLLAATDEARPEHGAAVTALDAWPASGTVLHTSGRILREYLVVATRPTTSNGLALPRLDAVANVRALGARLRPLAEDARVGDRLLQLLEEVERTGTRIHDANIVATMLVHGIGTVGTVVTANTRDFAGSSDRVRVVGLHP